MRPQRLGGSEAVRYFVSGEYANETGTFKLPDYERQRLLDARNVTELDDWTERPNTLDQVSLRANLNAAPSSRTDLAVNVGYVSSTVRLPQNDNNGLGMLPSGLLGRGSAADTSSPGSCGAACGGNSGCSKCVPGKSCGSDADCAQGEACALDHCLPAANVACRSRRECGDGELCFLSSYDGTTARGNQRMRAYCAGLEGENNGRR